MSDKKYEWNTPQQSDVPLSDGDIRIVSLPVKVIIKWSDQIVADYDSETKEVLEYTEGFIMEVLPGQWFVYDEEPTVLVAKTI
jgi:hypothetical protein